MSKSVFKPLYYIILLLVATISLYIYMYNTEFEQNTPQQKQILEVYTTKDIYYIDITDFIISSESGKYKTEHSTFESLQIEVTKITTIDNTSYE